MPKRGQPEGTATEFTVVACTRDSVRVRDRAGADGQTRQLSDPARLVPRCVGCRVVVVIEGADARVAALVVASPPRPRPRRKTFTLNDVLCAAIGEHEPAPADARTAAAARVRSTSGRTMGRDKGYASMAAMLDATNAQGRAALTELVELGSEGLGASATAWHMLPLVTPSARSSMLYNMSHVLEAVASPTNGWLLLAMGAHARAFKSQLPHYARALTACGVGADDAELCAHAAGLMVQYARGVFVHGQPSMSIATADMSAALRAKLHGASDGLVLEDDRGTPGNTRITQSSHRELERTAADLIDWLANGTGFEAVRLPATDVPLPHPNDDATFVTTTRGTLVSVPGGPFAVTAWLNAVVCSGVRILQMRACDACARLGHSDVRTRYDLLVITDASRASLSTFVDAVTTLRARAHGLPVLLMGSPGLTPPAVNGWGSPYQYMAAAAQSPVPRAADDSRIPAFVAVAYPRSTSSALSFGNEYVASAQPDAQLATSPSVCEMPDAGTHAAAALAIAKHVVTMARGESYVVLTTVVDAAPLARAMGLADRLNAGGYYGSVVHTGDVVAVAGGDPGYITRISRNGYTVQSANVWAGVSGGSGLHLTLEDGRGVDPRHTRVRAGLIAHVANTDFPYNRHTVDHAFVYRAPRDVARALLTVRRSITVLGARACAVSMPSPPQPTTCWLAERLLPAALLRVTAPSPRASG